jgi:hypothetical protein
MRVMRRNGNLIDEARTQSLDGSYRCKIVGVAGNRNSSRNQADKRGDGATRLKRVAATSERLQNLESDVPCANSDMFGVSDTKIDVTNVRAVDSQDTKMVIWDEAARRLTRHNSNESQ